MTATGGSPKLVAMAERVLSRGWRTGTTSVALIALLVGGTAGIAAVGSHLSSEIASAQQPSAVPLAPAVGNLTTPQAS